MFKWLVIPGKISNGRGIDVESSEFTCRIFSAIADFPLLIIAIEWKYLGVYYCSRKLPIKRNFAKDIVVLRI